MKGKTIWLLTAALAITLYSACELSEIDGAGDTGTDYSSDMGLDQSQYQTYHYVLIQDMEDPEVSEDTRTAGVDIYGVQLVKMGVTYNATQVHACAFGDGDNSRARDCNQVLGPPEGVCSATTSNPDYVSLGGLGGHIIVSFGSREEINTANEVRVYECGAAQNPTATAEYYDYFVGVSTDPQDANWVECVHGATGGSSCTVPVLPLVPIN
ncbi:MAG: hypothetical protein JW797_12820 [Bradymonadales bacterium]|nr:hypothetical protein [Bradymonadales bacterium]